MRISGELLCGGFFENISDSTQIQANGRDKRINDISNYSLKIVSTHTTEIL